MLHGQFGTNKQSKKLGQRLDANLMRSLVVALIMAPEGVKSQPASCQCYKHSTIVIYVTSIVLSYKLPPVSTKQITSAKLRSYFIGRIPIVKFTGLNGTWFSCGAKNRK